MAEHTAAALGCSTTDVKQQLDASQGQLKASYAAMAQLKAQCEQWAQVSHAYARIKYIG